MKELRDLKDWTIQEPNSSPQSLTKSWIPRPLACTAGGRIPASSGANQGEWKGRFDPTLDSPPTKKTAAHLRAQSRVISKKVFTKSFLKSQFPHKSVNLFLILVKMKNRWTDLCGSWLVRDDFIKHFLWDKGWGVGFRVELPRVRVCRSARKLLRSRQSDVHMCRPREEWLKICNWRCGQRPVNLWAWEL